MRSDGFSHFPAISPDSATRKRFVYVRDCEISRERAFPSDGDVRRPIDQRVIKSKNALLNIYIYIYIYKEREKERENEYIIYIII